VTCGDGKRRKFVPDLLFLSADHQEAMLHSGLKASASTLYPCCICLCPKADMGEPSVARQRNHPKRTNAAYVAMMQSALAAMQNGQQGHVVQRAFGDGTSQRIAMNGWLGFRSVDEEDQGLHSLMAPDVLHGLLEGLLTHFRTCMKEWAANESEEVTEREVMSVLDKRLQRVSQVCVPGWRIPTRDHRLWFTSSETFQAVEHESVLQVLPIVVRGIFVRDSVDYGTRAATAMAEWWLVTCRSPVHTPETLAQSDTWARRMMVALVEGFGRHQRSAWSFPKFHNIVHFAPFIRYIQP
jgi:Plavaka transposase